MRFAKPVCAGIILQSESDKFLLVLGREHKKWSFPKGHIEDGENWKECALRETLEETGLNVIIPENTKIYHTLKTVYFLLDMTSVEGECVLAPFDVTEITEINWFDKEALLAFSR